MTADRPTAVSALHYVHLGLGADMAESDGWLRPARYTTPEAEAESVRAGAGLRDVSAAGKLLLHGEIDRCVMDGLGQPAPEVVGEALLMRFTEDSGLGDVLAARLAADEALLITAPNQARMVTDTLGEPGGGCAHAVDMTSTLAGIQVAGPSAGSALAGVTDMDVSPHGLADMSCAQGSMSKVHAALVRRDLYSLPSYYVYVDRSHAEYLWQTLMDAGEPYGIAPFGAGALRQLRPQVAQRRRGKE